MLTETHINKLEQLDAPVLTFEGAEGYPVSVPVDIEVNGGSEASTLRVKDLPRIAQSIPAESSVNLLFNSIEALDAGGYGERRYLQVFGSLHGDIVEISRIEGWDEEELDFLSLVQQGIPRGSRYLREFNEELLRRTLQENKEALVITALDGSPMTRRTSYVIDDDNTMYFFGQFTEPSIRQLDLSPTVKMMLDPPEGLESAQGIEIEARASFVNDEAKKAELADRLAKHNPGIYTAMHQLKQTSRIVQLKPFRMTYGSRTELESIGIVENRPSLLSQLKTAATTRFKYWLYGVRAPFFTAALIPVFVGTAAAYYAGYGVDWWLFFLAVVGMLFIQAGANVSNDFFDHVTSNDEYNNLYSPVNGGSRFIQAGLATPAKLFVASSLFFVAGASIGLVLNAASPGNTILFLGLAGGLLAFFYTAGPLRLAYRGVGDFVIAIAFGPIPVLGAFYLQSETLELATAKVAFAAAVPVGILVALILFINSFQDYDADARAGKQTSIVLLGKKNAATMFAALLVFNYTWIVIMVVMSVLPWPVLISLLTAPLAWKMINSVRALYAKIYELLPVNFTQIATHLTVGLLITIGFVISAWAGVEV